MKNHLRTFVLVIVVLIIGLWIIRSLFYEGYIRLNYPSFNEFPVQGIDISHHQKNIDWKQLNKDQVQFIFMKATEGKDFKDPNFQSYAHDASLYNIPIGAYHFFTFCSHGKDQAAHFIKEVPRELLTLPPAIDLEFGGNCNKIISDEQLIKEISIYIQNIERHYLKKVIIYATQEFYQSHLRSQFMDNPIWIRDIYKRPTLKENRTWLFWQFANRGKLDGINGFVDLNVFSGNKSDFNNYLGIIKNHSSP